MLKLEHCRICGYLLTLAMHIGNTVVAKMTPRDQSVIDDPQIKRMMSMEHCYFTVWNIGLQLMYVSFGLYCDVSSLLDQRHKKKWSKYLKFRKTFFSAILWPSTLFVFTLFWPLFIYDRSIIFPEFVDKIVSKTGNFIIHAAIVLVVLWETAFLPIEVPASHKKNLTIVTLEAAIYLSWITYVNSVRNVWPYPILHILEGSIYLPLFFAAAYSVFILHYFTQWRVRKVMWSKSVLSNKSS